VSIDRAFVQSLIDEAGPSGHLVVTFRDYLTPVLNEAGEAVKDDRKDDDGNPVGETVLAHHPLGHIRTISGYPVILIDTHLGIGFGPGKPIDHLIAFSDIDRVHADLGELPLGELAQATEASAPAPSEPEVPPPSLA